MLDMYGEVASGLKACLGHMGPWSLGDLVLGLRHVKSRHESHDVSDNIPGQEVLLSACPQIFQYLHQECSLACAAYYIPDVSKMTSEARLEGNFEIVHVHQATDRFKPAFFVMKDTDAKLVRVVVRGTNDLNDVLTDIAGHWEAVDGGFAHSGVLKSAEWLLDQTVQLLLDIPIQASEQYGLRFSGHSLGAGAAALATHLLRTQPHRFPSLLTTFPRPQVDCFCAAAPPVLSLDLARASADYITTLTLGHDVVARASIANLEQLRLEVLTSGWWEEMVDPVVKSRTFQNVQAVLERVGAKELVLLARNAGRAYDERRAAAVGDAGNDAATPPRSMIVSALDRLHEVYTAPTTQRSVTAHNASSSHIGGVIEGLLASSRESTRGVTNALLDRVSAISSKSPAELSSLAGNAAAAAWQAAAVATAPAAAAAAGRISDRHTAPRAGVPNRGGREGMPSVQEAKQPPSWLGTFMTGTAAACSAAFTVVSEATKPGQALIADRGTGATSASKDRGADAAAAGAATSSLASEVSRLDATIEAERLYVPGRLLHLRRPPRPAPPGDAPPCDAGAVACDADEGEDAALQLEDVMLVDGDPMDARFEFIAVRSTWLSDHSLVSMLKALEAAERRR